MARGPNNLLIADQVSGIACHRYGLEEYARDITDQVGEEPTSLITLVKSVSPQRTRRVIYPWLRFFGITITKEDS